MHKAAVLEGHGGDELWGLAVNPAREVPQSFFAQDVIFLFTVIIALI
jgi:hypothetical protein